MSSDDQKGFAVTPARVSFILGLVGLLGVVWQTVSYAKTQEFEILKNAAQVEDMREQNKAIVKRLDHLNELVSELVFIVKGSELTNKRAALPQNTRAE